MFSKSVGGLPKLWGAVMKKIAAIAILAALPALPAFAADNDGFAAPLVIAAPVEPWAGFYVGLHAGYGFGTEFDTQSALYPEAEEGGADVIELRGPVAGFHLGFNVQQGRFVFGVEGDLDWSRIHGSTDYAYLGDPDSPLRLGTLSFSTNLETSARIRAGFAVGDSALVYATGGVAFARGTLTDDGLLRGDDPLGGPVAFSQWFRGITFGGGYEQVIGEGVSARLEVRHSRFGTELFPYAYDFAGQEIEVNFNQTTATAGVTMHF